MGQQSQDFVTLTVVIGYCQTVFSGHRDSVVTGYCETN